MSQSTVPCDVCGRPTSSKYGVCDRAAPCTREQRRRQRLQHPELSSPDKRRRWRQASLARKGAVCAVCQEPSAAECGACRRTPECRAERARRLLGPEARPCAVCGIPTPDKLGACQRTPACKAEWHKRDRLIRGAAQRRRWRERYASDEDFRTRIVERNRAARQADPERVREIGRKSRNRPGRPCRYAKAGCTEPCAPGCNACREHRRADLARRAERKRTGLLGRLATDQAGLCIWCMQPLPADLDAAHVDHIIPRARGGPDEEWNLQLLHGGCNQRKSATITPQALTLAQEHHIALTCEQGGAPDGEEA